MTSFVRNDKLSPASRFMFLIDQIQRDCVLFRTVDQRFGYATGSFQEGDQVVVFDGAMTAHLVREHLIDSRSVYELVGVAYVRGMMHGELDTLHLDCEDFTLV